MSTSDDGLLDGIFGAKTPDERMTINQGALPYLTENNMRRAVRGYRQRFSGPAFIGFPPSGEMAQEAFYQALQYAEDDNFEEEP